MSGWVVLCYHQLEVCSTTVIKKANRCSVVAKKYTERTGSTVVLLNESKMKSSPGGIISFSHCPILRILET